MGPSGIMAHQPIIIHGVAIGKAPPSIAIETTKRGGLRRGQEGHAGEASSNPQNWMPWNYRQTLDSTAAALDAARCPPQLPAVTATPPPKILHACRKDTTFEAMTTTANDADLEMVSSQTIENTVGRAAIPRQVRPPPFD